MKQEQPRALDRRQQVAVEFDDVVGHHVEGGRVELLAVDLDAARRDQLLGIAARGDADAGKPLGDAFAGDRSGDLAHRFNAEIRLQHVSDDSPCSAEVRGD